MSLGTVVVVIIIGFGFVIIINFKSGTPSPISSPNYSAESSGAPPEMRILQGLSFLLSLHTRTLFYPK